MFRWIGNCIFTCFKHLKEVKILSLELNPNLWLPLCSNNNKYFAIIFCIDVKSTGKDYLSFPDKISTLLFLLQHSPRPMVCESMFVFVVKCVLHICVC